MSALPSSAPGPARRPFGAGLARGPLRPFLLFFLSLLLLDRAVFAFRDVWERHSPDEYDERLRGLRAHPRDFVVVGGSPVSEGLDPDLLSGLRWRDRTLKDGYAIGLPGGTTSCFYHALLHGCPTPPRLLIYGITASDMNDRRQQPQTAAALMDWRDLVVWVRLRPDTAEWAVRKFAEGKLQRAWSLFRYRHGIRMWAAETVERVVPGSCPEGVEEARKLLSISRQLREGRGYAPNPQMVNRRFDLAREAALRKPWRHLDNFRTGSHLRYLHRMLAWARRSATDVVLVDMPVTEVLEERHAAAFREYRQRLAELERQYPDVMVLRPGREGPGLDDACFADTIHLNGAGARKLSTWLRARLDERGPQIRENPPSP